MITGASAPRAAEVLGKLGPTGEAAVPALTKALTRKDRHSGEVVADVQIKAAEALWLIEGKAETVVPLLQEHLAPDSGHRREAADVLGRMGSAAAPAVDSLASALKRMPRDDYWYSYARYLERRSAPFQALGNLGKIARPAVPALQAALKDEDPLFQLLAAETLWKVNRQATDCVPVARALLRNESAAVRSRAVEVLGLIGPDAAATAGELANVLKDPYSEVAGRAASALGQIGPAAKEAVPSLVVALKHEDSGVQKTAAKALKKIDPEAAARQGIR
jgi:HEAT repeat protein